MNRKEQGFLLLTSPLGDPERKILTAAQFRTLAKRMHLMERPVSNGELHQADLQKLGYDPAFSRHILALLSQQRELTAYLEGAALRKCYPLARISDGYPAVLRSRLGLDAPGCLWAKGELSLLKEKAVALVGSRDLREDNREFARQVGIQAARQGYVLVSGNARGADQTAQEACLSHGGRVICVIADSLWEHPLREGVLYLSEQGWELPFSTVRALSRNRLIHALGSCTLIAQCTLGKGGTWRGTTENLKRGWSPVFCFHDGSDCTAELQSRGAGTVRLEDLTALDALKMPELNLFNQ